jgi:hypothetical protein
MPIADWPLQIESAIGDCRPTNWQLANSVTIVDSISSTIRQYNHQSALKSTIDDSAIANHQSPIQSAIANRQSAIT